MSAPSRFHHRRARRRAASPSFVTRTGSTLLLDGQTFRFAGCNIYWLGLDFASGGFAPPPTGTLIVPSTYRVDDAYATAAQLGLGVVRSQSLGGSVGHAGTLYPTLGGSYTESVFRAMDYAIARAPDYGLRLILTFLDNNYGYYWGGWDSFGGWGAAGGSANFFTDAGALANVKSYISAILGRVNSVSGLTYSDDPTIMAWETGNELSGPSAWTSAIAAHIKGLAPRQLVIDGHYGIDSASLSDANVDIVSDHFYPLSVTRLSADAGTANLSNKVFVVGEYDWNNVRAGGDALAAFLPALEGTPAVAGDLWWSLSSHGDLHGYAADSNDYSNAGGGSFDCRYGDPAIQSKILSLRAHAYAMRARSAPSAPVPGPPLITSASGATLSWRGAAGAATYVVERSTQAADRGFSAVASSLSDLSSPWTDPSPPGGATWYRVRGQNATGTPGLASPASAV